MSAKSLSESRECFIVVYIDNWWLIVIVYFSKGQTDIQTDWHTDPCPPTDKQMGEIFNALFASFYFNMFASLTLFIKDKSIVTSLSE
jgi:hypothetical protein